MIEYRRRRANKKDPWVRTNANPVELTREDFRTFDFRIHGKLYSFDKVHTFEELLEAFNKEKMWEQLHDERNTSN